MITLTCREHGGTFTVPSKRGRRPVRCGGASPNCSRSGDNDAPRANEIEGKHAQRAESNAEPRKTINPSLAPAMAAKALLEAQGWTVIGKGRWTEKSEYLSFKSGRTATGGVWGLAELTAARGDELLTIAWMHGELVEQDYSLWSEVPRENNKPKGSLTFDPDECTDRELIRALSGMRVTWWNKLGQLEETAVIDDKRITIEHAYNGIGDEAPGDRIVKFIDKTGAGFRAFRVAALLKVG